MSSNDTTDRGRPAFDLQSHSTHSDGTLPAGEVVRRAAAAGVRTLALTDHDTTAGVEEAVAAAAELPGVAVVPAVEMTAVTDAHADLHVLGYGIDVEHAGLVALLAASRAERGTRADRMGVLLSELGWALDHSALDARRQADEPIGRPHLAQAAFGHPANARRLADEGLGTATDLLVAYLTPGAPAFLTREHPTVADAIAVIHAAGGLAIWAHPFWDVADPAVVLATIDRFTTGGLDGVEVFYATHTEEQVRLLHATCVARGLRTTGSADFHGPDHPNFSRFAAFEMYGLPPDLRGIVAG